MDNYIKICKIIESGNIAQMDTKDGFILFSSITSDGNIRSSGYKEKTTQEAYNYLGTYWYTKGAINNIEGKISVYQKPVWYPKEGGKVEILESVKQSPGYNKRSKEKKQMLGGPFEVLNIHDSTVVIYVKDKNNRHTFDYRHIAPRIHDEEEVMTGKKVTVTIDGKEYSATID